MIFYDWCSQSFHKRKDNNMNKSNKTEKPEAQSSKNIF